MVDIRFLTHLVAVIAPGFELVSIRQTRRGEQAEDKQQNHAMFHGVVDGCCCGVNGLSGVPGIMFSASRWLILDSGFYGDIVQSCDKMDETRSPELDQSKGEQRVTVVESQRAFGYGFSFGIVPKD